MTTEADVRGALELRGPAVALLDEPLTLGLRGAGTTASVVWRGRVRDDDGRVWRARAETVQGLDDAWVPAKATGGAHAVLQSLRPLRVELRAELPDGRAAARTVTRVLLGDGVRVRRWRDGLAATLLRPATEPVATVLVDATAPTVTPAQALPAAALLASRGALVVTVWPVPGRPSAELVAQASERTAAVPGATLPSVLCAGEDVPLPPGVPGGADLPVRAAAWDAVLVDLGAQPRRATC